MKRTVAVFFGGRSVEHDISIVTGQQLMENIDAKKYDVVPVYIARDGNWFTGDKLRSMSFLQNFNASDPGIVSVYLPQTPGSNALVATEAPKSGGLFSKKQQQAQRFQFDVAIPAMHGLNGEDGSLQGLFELADIPYAGSGVLGSAAGMDKILMKDAFRGAGIPVLESAWFWRDEWEIDPERVIAMIESQLEYPIFIKPANLGSSIGISKAKDRDGLYHAIEIAVRYDRRILADEGVENIAEYNCSVIGCGYDARASVCEQPVAWKDLLSFEDKYLRGSKENNSSGMKSMSRIIPAPIEEGLTKEIQRLSVEIFRSFDCKGVVRIDYIFDKDSEQLYANEINTIPGSFAFYLWEEEGLPYPQLINELVEYAIQAHKEKNRNVYAFDSEVLKKTNWGSKGSKK